MKYPPLWRSSFSVWRDTSSTRLSYDTSPRINVSYLTRRLDSYFLLSLLTSRETSIHLLATLSAPLSRVRVLCLFLPKVKTKNTLKLKSSAIDVVVIGVPLLSFRIRVSNTPMGTHDHPWDRSNPILISHYRKFHSSPPSRGVYVLRWSSVIFWWDYFGLKFETSDCQRRSSDFVVSKSPRLESFRFLQSPYRVSVSTSVYQTQSREGEWSTYGDPFNSETRC